MQGCRGAGVQRCSLRAVLLRSQAPPLLGSLGAEDIGVWICAADGPIAAAFNPRIRFQRTQTLMEGNDCCDHVYYIDRDPYERMSESTNQRVGRDAHSPVR